MEFGVPFSVPEFNRQAIKLDHPFDSSGLSHQDLSYALFELLTLGPKQVKAKRDSQFSHYMRRAASLAKNESALKAGLPEPARRILEPKRLLLFKEMCQDAGVADETLFDQLVNGFPLLGRGADAPEFPLQSRPPKMTPEGKRRQLGPGLLRTLP